MMRIPDLAAIRAVELRLEQSALDTRKHLRLARATSRALLTRPSTVVMAMGAAGLLGFVLARRTSSAEGSAAAAATSTGTGLVTAFVVRYVLQNLPCILQRARAALQQRTTAGPLGMTGTV